MGERGGLQVMREKPWARVDGDRAQLLNTSPLCCRSHGPSDAMRCSVRRCLVTLVAIGFLWLFVTLRVPEEIEEDEDVMTIKGQVAALALGVGLRGKGGIGAGRAVLKALHLLT